MNSKSWDNCITLFSVCLLVGWGYEAVSFSGVSNTIRLSFSLSHPLSRRLLFLNGFFFDVIGNHSSRCPEGICSR